jgi:hypothetical protein
VSWRTRSSIVAAISQFSSNIVLPLQQKVFPVVWFPVEPIVLFPGAKKYIPVNKPKPAELSGDNDSRQNGPMWAAEAHGREFSMN